MRLMVVRRLFLLTFLALLSTQALSQTGTLGSLKKDGQARVVWDPDTPAPQEGSLGTVVERNRQIAVFRVLNTDGNASSVQIMDIVIPGLVRENQRARLLDLEPAPSSSEQASILVWSDRSGGTFKMDGSVAGQAPKRVIVQPGVHEIVLELPEGGKAGARFDAKPGESLFLCLHGRSGPSPEGEDGYSQFIPFAVVQATPDQRPRLLWLEDRQGQQVYGWPGPLGKPILKKRISPRFPELMRASHKEGTVIFDAILGTDGRVEQLDLILSSDPQFTTAALEAVRQWVYDPATRDGKPVRIFFTIIVDFHMTR